MKRYVRALVCVIYTFIKFSILKLFHIKKFNFGMINLVSPLTEIDIGLKAEMTLGEKIKIRSGSKLRVRKKAIMQIGKNTSLNHGCIFTAHEKISIGDNVQFGPNVLIYDHDHDFKKKDGLKNLLYKTNPVEIGDNVWIGANVVILRGTKIGNNSVIGTGCVLRGEFPENAVIVQKRETTVVEKAGVK